MSANLIDPVQEPAAETKLPRQRYVLEDTGFDEVPKKYRRFYRKWGGRGDVLAPNEVLCPVCKVVIRSTRELRVGDRVYPCTGPRIHVSRSSEIEEFRLAKELSYDAITDAYCVVGFVGSPEPLPALSRRPPDPARPSDEDAPRTGEAEPPQPE